MKSKETFFSSVQRSRMIWDTLLRIEFGDGYGIKQLLANSTYAAAYPLHEVRSSALPIGMVTAEAGHLQDCKRLKIKLEIRFRAHVLVLPM